MFYTGTYSHGHTKTGRETFDISNYAVMGVVKILRGTERILRWCV
jgi:hypothetical protein